MNHMRTCSKHHPLMTREEVIAKINNKRNLPDANYISNLLNAAINYLDDKKVFKYEDFASVLKKNSGLNMTQIFQLIIDFKTKIKEEFKHLNYNVDWINKRSLSKSDFSDKNIILNCLALEFPNHFFDFLINYLPTINNLNNDYAISQYKNKIQSIQIQSQDSLSQIKSEKIDFKNEENYLDNNMDFDIFDNDDDFFDSRISFDEYDLIDN